VKPLPLFKGSLRTLAQHKIRSFFVMLGCLVGAAALTWVVAIGRGVERKILTTVRQNLGTSAILVSSGSGFMTGGARTDAGRLTLDDVRTVAEALPAVELWEPLQSLEAPVRRGESAGLTRVVGSTERGERAWGRGVTRGEWFDAPAVQRSARVALIGETTARELFGAEDPVGAEILVGNVPLRVIGVLQPFGTDAHGMDRDAEVVVPISTLMRRIMNVDSLSGAKLVVTDARRAEETAAEVRRMLRERHALPAERADDFHLMTPAQIDRMVGRVRAVLFMFLPLVAGVALLAGGAVAATLMLLSVSERRGEIGLRRAVGARPRDIALQIVVESAATTLLGGAAGAALGCAGALAVAARLGLDIAAPWGAALLGLALSVAIGVAAGAIPARRAAALHPVEALR
jgi:putative ABC transport system permease protein